MSKGKRAYTAEQVVQTISTVISDKQGEDTITIDMQHKSPFTDFMIITSAQVSRKGTAIANAIISQLKKDFSLRVNIEGSTDSGWLLLDAGDVVVHIFHPDKRKHYDLEKMWIHSL